MDQNYINIIAEEYASEFVKELNKGIALDPIDKEIHERLEKITKQTARLAFTAGLKIGLESNQV